MRLSKFISACGTASVLAASAEAADIAKVVQGRIVLTKLAEQLPAGSAVIQHDDLTLLGCRPGASVKSDGALKPIDVKPYAPLFEAEVSGTNSLGVQSTANLFSESAQDDAISYEVGGLVHGMTVKFCGQKDRPQVSVVGGEGRLKVLWQIYSRAKHQVVATIETEGISKRFTAQNSASMVDVLLRDAFVDAIKKFARSTELTALLKEAPTTDALESRPGEQSHLAARPGPNSPRSANDAIGAVVVVETGDGHGSGALISSDGYVLTDAHVVEANGAVRVRWSDGLVTQGQVVRVHKKRDVALIKTDPRGRTPLAIRTSPVQAGEAVLAIGAPLDEALQSTVTKGVVSANRIVGGFSFIQSDVTVHPGNSGGPLIDEQGAVIGLTDWGFQPDGTPTNLNFFIPIKDALDFLSLDLTPAPSPASPPAQKVSAPAAPAKTR